MNHTDLDILYLTTKDVPDYLQDALYLGFNELGCNIVDYPSKGSLHGIPHNSEYNIPHLLFNFPERELRKDPDLIIVPSMFCDFGKYKTRENWIQFVLETVKKYPPTTKTIILDTEDHTNAFYPNLNGREYDVVFKRELSYKPFDNWYGINFSSVPEKFTYVPFNQRKYDVSFVATISNLFRVAVKDYLLKRADELKLSVFVHVEKNPIDRAEYLEVLSQSRTAISAAGAGKDCYRYWEIPAKGVVLISEHTGLLIEDDFRCFNHKFEFNGLDNLGIILEQIKNKPIEELERMALNSLVHSFEYHSPKKRAEYILKGVFKNVS